MIRPNPAPGSACADCGGHDDDAYMCDRCFAKWESAVSNKTPAYLAFDLSRTAAKLRIAIERIQDLENALRAAANSLGTIASQAGHRPGMLEDMDDVRGHANARWTVACKLLPEAKCRCSRCGCLPTRHRVDDEALCECQDCECTEYESDDT